MLKEIRKKKNTILGNKQNWVTFLDTGKSGYPDFLIRVDSVPDFGHP